MTTCPEIHGRRNKLGTPAEMLKKLTKLPMPMGVLHREERPEYGASYETIITRAKAALGGRDGRGDGNLPPSVPSCEAPSLAAPFEVRLCGEGGQGVVLASIVLAEAAIHDGRNAVQTQEYGPESRGGAATSEAIISDAEIDYPRSEDVDILCALTTEAYEKHGARVKEGGILVADSSITMNQATNGVRVCRLPMIETAVERTGKAIAANAVALGAIAALGAPVSREALERMLLRRVPAATAALNRAALDAGYDLARSAD